MFVTLAPKSAERRYRRRHRRKLSMGRIVRRLISHLTLGFLLVGCGSPRLSVGQFGTVQSKSLDSNPLSRVSAYRQCRRDLCPRELHPEAIQLLTNAVTADGHPISRSAAAAALATYHDSMVKEKLSAAALDPSPLVRYEAARGLSEFADQGAVPQLGKLAQTDEDVEVRRAAVAGLKKAGDAESRKAAMLQLAACVKDKDFTVSRAAADALKERTGCDFGRDYDQWAAFLQAPAPAQRSIGPKPTAAPFLPVAN